MFSFLITVWGLTARRVVLIASPGGVERGVVNRAMLPIGAVVLAALCFATTGTAQAVADVEASPTAVGAARILLGGGVLGLLVLARPRPRGRAVSGVRGGSSAWIVALGAAGVLAYQPAFFTGTQANGVAVGTVVALGSAPIATGIVDGVLHRRLPGARWFFATTIAVAGVILVSGVSGVGTTAEPLDPVGLLGSVGAGFSYAVYTVAGKALLDRAWSPVDAMGAMFGTAAAFSLPVLLLAGGAWLWTPAGALLALWLGLVTTAVAYLLFGWGLARLRATTVSTLTLAEPLGATVLGLALLGERLSPATAVGIGAIVVGLVLLGLPSRSSREQIAGDVSR